jgi:hypothetical protein
MQNALVDHMCSGEDPEVRAEPTEAAVDASDAKAAVRARKWRHMQRIEHYRHQACLAEQEAVGQNEVVAGLLLQVARVWRELAEVAEQAAAQDAASEG